MRCATRPIFMPSPTHGLSASTIYLLMSICFLMPQPSRNDQFSYQSQPTQTLNGKGSIPSIQRGLRVIFMGSQMNASDFKLAFLSCRGKEKSVKINCPESLGLDITPNKISFIIPCRHPKYSRLPWRNAVLGLIFALVCSFRTQLYLNFYVYLGHSLILSIWSILYEFSVTSATDKSEIPSM